MAKKQRLMVADLNPHLSCILCGGYFIDATTINECLHSFCRACIVRYLETSRYCPVCEVQIHKTRPLRCIRSDRILQNIVYKLVPGLYQNEMSRRRELYASQPPEALKESRDEEDRGEGLEHRFIYTGDEMFDLILRCYCNKTFSVNNTWKEIIDSENNSAMQRYMRCPAAVKVTHLKKFIRYKYDVPSQFAIGIWYDTNLLDDDYSLMDIAYIYSWKRAGPLQLLFRVLDFPTSQAKHLQLSKCTAEALTEEKQMFPEKETVDATANSFRDTRVLKTTKLKNFKKGKHSRKGSRSKSSKSVSTKQTSDTHVNDKHSSSSTSYLTKETRGKPKIKQLDSNSQLAGGEQSTESFAPIPENVTQEPASVPDTKDASFEAEEKLPPLKVPKLTIPLTLKIKQQAAYHAEEEKIDSDGDLSEDRLIIVETESVHEDDEKEKEPTKDDKNFKKIGGSTDDYEIDSGRGSDSSSRAEEGSFSGDDNACSPKSFTHPSPLCSPDSPLIHSFPPSPSKEGEKAKAENSLSPANDEFGALDLSTCHRKRTHERILLSQAKHFSNPAVLDKQHQVAPCTSVPKHPSFKLLPSLHPHASNCKKSEPSQGGFRYKRGSTLTVINPDPNSCRTKIVIKNLDPKPRHHHQM